MVVICSALTLVALPFFMVGGLAVQIKEALGLSEAALGGVVTIGFLAGAVSAPIGGRVADRIGPKLAVYLGCGLCALALLGIGVVADDWLTLMLILCLAGVAVALTDPALAILIGRTIPSGRQGLAFGIKEASIPASTLIAGLAVPTIALTVGWEWAFAIGAIPLALIVILLPRIRFAPAPAQVLSDHPADPNPRPSPARRALLIATAAGALGTLSSSGVGIFLTDSAVAMGFSPAGAGILLAVGSVAGMCARVAAGARADKTGGPQFRLIASMLAVGAAGLALGSTGVPVLLVVATLAAFTGGWAWTGLFFLSLVAAYPDRPGAVAGLGTFGLGLGNAAGPVMFGLAAGSVSYGFAWIGAAVVTALASVLMTVARRGF